MAINSLVLEGRLTKNPEVHSTTSGKEVCSFTVANDKPGKDNGTNFIDCVAWEKRGEVINKYFSKGSRIFLRGHLDQQSWEKDGQKRSKLVVIIDDFSFVDKKEDSVEKQSEPEEIDLSEIPF